MSERTFDIIVGIALALLWAGVLFCLLAFLTSE
jgi:hypothetical protein